MGLHTRSGKQSRRRFGYTLVEIVIVLTIISILVSIAVPLYQKALLRTKESVLRNNLFTLRTVIDTSRRESSDFPARSGKKAH